MLIIQQLHITIHIIQKSSSSKNKITLEEIKTMLEEKGETKVFDKPYKFFNAGKTELKNHKEYVFITKVEK